MNRRIVLCLLAVALFPLTGCGVGSDAAFFVTIASDGEGSSGFVPQGYGWTPKKQIDISLWGEPRLEGKEVVTTGEWKSLGVVTPDEYGMFGFNSGAFKYFVKRTIPNQPPPWLPHVIFLAREKDSGKVRFYTVACDAWFTFKP
jgi:hypothetical protein